jgi:hypothetical protein
MYNKQVSIFRTVNFFLFNSNGCRIFTRITNEGLLQIIAPGTLCVPIVNVPPPSNAPNKEGEVANDLAFRVK